MARILNLSGLKMDAARDEVHTEPDGGTYQVIVTWALLAAHPAHEAHDVLRPLVDLLEPMGELHIIEPSAEFAAREILAGRVGMPIWAHLFGSDERPHRSAATLPMLRAYLTDLGLVPARATTDTYVVAVDKDGNEYKADRHVVVGVKPDTGAKRWID